jgi:hypothetical protein
MLGVTAGQPLRRRRSRHRQPISLEVRAIWGQARLSSDHGVGRFHRVEALELLGVTLAHLNDAEATGEVSVRVPLLLAIRDKLATALREES